MWKAWKSQACGKLGNRKHEQPLILFDVLVLTRKSGKGVRAGEGGRGRDGEEEREGGREITKKRSLICGMINACLPSRVKRCIGFEMQCA